MWLKTKQQNQLLLANELRSLSFQVNCKTPKLRAQSDRVSGLNQDIKNIESLRQDLSNKQEDLSDHINEMKSVMDL